MSDDQAATAGGDGAREQIERLATRAVASVLTLVRRGIALAGGVLIFAVVASVGGFLLGLAALSGGIETVWIVLGGFFGVLAIGSALVALRRLRGVQRSGGALVTELQELIAGDRRTERTVIETVETSDAENEGVVVLSRQFFTMRQSIGDRVGQFRTLASALTAVTTFPGLVALATLVSFVFAGLGLLFLIALAL